MGDHYHYGRASDFGDLPKGSLKAIAWLARKFGLRTSSGPVSGYRTYEEQRRREALFYDPIDEHQRHSNHYNHHGPPHYGLWQEPSRGLWQTPPMRAGSFRLDHVDEDWAERTYRYLQARYGHVGPPPRTCPHDAPPEIRCPFCE